MIDEAILLSLMECTIEPKSAVYCAVPITSGIRLWQLANELGLTDIDQVKTVDAKRFDAEVIRPNCDSARAFVHAARERHGVIINPSKLVVPSWSQGQYTDFWESVIERFVHSVMLSPNWIYSRGCVFECMFALRLGIDLFDDVWNPVSPNDLLPTVKEAQGLRDFLHIKADYIDDLNHTLSNAARK